jgi:hypothetical protein
MYNPVYVSAHGRIQINFGWLKSRPSFDYEEKHRELLIRANHIKGLAIPEEGIENWPAFDLVLLPPASSLRQFLDVLAWVADEARSHQPG